MAKKAATAALDDFLAQYGGDGSEKPIEVISTGIILLDAALGRGGFPRGRIVELFGAESSGKSTIAMSTAAETLKRGLYVLYLDFEHSFSAEYAALFGIDAINDKRFVLQQPDTAEEGCEITRKALATGAFGTIVWDSVAAMQPRCELEEPDKQHVAPLARMLSPELRRIVPMVDDSQAILILINHIHEKIGMTGPGGPPKTTPGGKAVKHYATVRVETKMFGPIKGKTVDLQSGNIVQDRVGSFHVASIAKNKVSMPGPKGSFIIRDGWGLCEPQMVVEALQKRGIVKLSGAYYTLPGTDKKLQGMESVLEYLRENPGISEQLRDTLRETLNISTASDAKEEAEDDDGYTEDSR